MIMRNKIIVSIIPDQILIYTINHNNSPIWHNCSKLNHYFSIVSHIYSSGNSDGGNGNDITHVLCRRPVCLCDSQLRKGDRLYGLGQRFLDLRL